MTIYHLARIGYEAYAANTGGKTFDGRDMPKWEDLPQRTIDAWAAVTAVNKGSEPVKRPLRSVMLGNPSYLSAYVLGVAQAMAQLGHWHRDVSVLDDLDRVARQFEEMRPDVIWTHTIPWVPREAPARRAGCS
jgi:hypothetical protein